MGLFTDNPVLQREMRVRLRARRLASQKAVLWTLGLLAVVILYFYVRGLAGIAHGSAADAREFWALLVDGLLFLIVLLAPALTATAISQEREQQTWDALATTPLTAGQILIGKWLARQAPLALLILLALPLVLGCAVRGEVGLPLTLAAVLLLLLTGGVYGAIGLACSFRARRTSMATAIALTLTAFLCLGTLVIDLLIRGFRGYYGGAETPVMWVNPFYALAALIGWLRPDQGDLYPRLSTADHPGAIVAVYILLSAAALALCLGVMIARYRAAAQEQ